MGQASFVRIAQITIKKTSFMAGASLLLVGGLFVSKAYGGGPGACSDNIPDAVMSIQPTDKAVGSLQATLSGSSSVACSDPIVDYAWDFGDGSTANGVNVQHEFAIGTYYPSLTITDAAGLQHTNTSRDGVIVKASNQAPVLGNASVSVLQGENVVVDMSSNGSDPDGDDIAHSYYLPQDTRWGDAFATEKGYVQRNADTGIFTYSAQPGSSGADSFEVGIKDGFGGTATATVSITIDTHVTAVADTATTQEGHDVTINVVANDTSYQNEPFEIYWTSLSANGGHITNIDKQAGTITFRPDPGFVGTVQVEYGIKSLVPNTWRVSTAPVSIEVFPDPNHAPAATNDSLTLNEDATDVVNILSNDSDQDGDALTVAITKGPQHGAATIDPDGTLHYTPAANYYGTDTVTYRITDTGGKTATATVTITIASVNDAPQASFTWNAQGAGNVSFNASGSSDIDGGIASYHWDFGDGSSATTTTATTSHKYKGKASRTATLTVTDTSGTTATYSATVTP
jgi:VCBS repeat-containing protein